MREKSNLGRAYSRQWCQPETKLKETDSESPTENTHRGSVIALSRANATPADAVAVGGGYRARRSLVPSAATCATLQQDERGGTSVESVGAAARA